MWTTTTLHMTWRGCGLVFHNLEREGGGQLLVCLGTHLRQADGGSPMKTAATAQGFVLHIAAERLYAS